MDKTTPNTTEKTAGLSDLRGLIVGIGASAGGLEPLRSFFSAMPNHTGMSFIVLQHQAPTKQSLLPDLIAQVTPMTVTVAKHGALIRPNHIYVCPPQTVLTLKGRRLQLKEVESSGERRTPISRFLQSLAEAHKERSVGVILSGAGSDGTFGLRAISDAGGMSLVQDCKTAQFDGMPRSAIATGVADFELPCERMPEVLVDHLEYLNSLDAQDNEDPLAQAILSHVDDIAATVREVTEHDFASYKSSTLVRRIKRRMQILHISAVEDYLERLREDRMECQALFKEMLISVTTFFRDAQAFRSLDEKVLPRLFEDRDVTDRVRIWVPGCATGQEAYSIAMLVCEHLDRLPDHVRPPRIQIFATDIDESAIHTAREGRYPIRMTEDISQERLERFFIRKGQDLEVVSRLRDMCLFSVHNLISDPPFSQIDLISCRNVLIYFDASLQDRVLPMFHYALRDDGHLFLGSSETITSQEELFRAVDSRQRIWQRRPEAPRTLTTPPKMSRAWRPSRARRPRQHLPDIFEMMQQVVLDQFAPQAVVVNGEGQILCAAEGAKDYLQISGGVFQNNIVKMARSGLRVGLRTALNQAKNAGERVERDDLSIKNEDGVQRLKLTVTPMPHVARDSDLYIVVFEKAGQAMKTVHSDLSVPNEEAESFIEHLERELNTTRDDLEQTVQELEASNEELKSSNEELLSMNEELQSANEELEVSKEEVEAANEALAKANADLENLLTSTRLATIFLDDKGCVQRFTPAVNRLYHLIEQDVGRPLSHITHQIVDMPELPDPRKLRESDTPVEHEVRTYDRRYYIRRVLPYYTPEGPDKGIVVTFIDVTELKKAQERASRLAALVEASSEAIIGKALDGTITAWNAGAERTYGYSVEQAVGQHISMIVPDERREELDELMKEVSRGNSVDGFETVRIDKEGNRRHILLTASPIASPEGEVLGVSAVGRDITELKAVEEELRRRTRELERAKRQADAASQSKSEFLANMSHEIRTPMTAILGYADVLLAHIDDPDNRQCVDTIKRNANYLLEIINDILDLSKIEAGKLEVKDETVAPDNLVAEVASLMHVRAEEKRIPLAIEFDGKLPEVIETDPTRLRQILINLVGNAIKFTDEGQVRVRTSFENDTEPRLRFDVSDTGIGISEEHQRNLFEPFRQADTSETRQYEGTGLGLTICKRLADALGGEISVSSTPGEGSTFTVRVPVGSGNGYALVEPRRGITFDRRQPGASDISIEGRILVVDDRHDIRYLASFFIDRAGGTVETAANGRQAIETIERAERDGQPIDMVVMDMQMPEMDGYEAVRKLRKKGFDRPILALTAAAMSDDRDKCLSIGCTDYTSKPVDGRRLVELVAKHLAGDQAKSCEQTVDREATHVLLVDDNQDTCNALCLLLELNDCTAVACQTGAQALEVASAEAPDVVVLDLGLPDISGYELVGELRELEALADATFIALSGRSSTDDIERSLQCGFDHYLVKPASPDDLLELFPGRTVAPSTVETE